MEETLELLKKSDQVFDRIIVIVAVLKKYRDRGLLNPYLLDEKLTIMSQLALEKRDEFTLLIKKLQDEQNI